VERNALLPYFDFRTAGNGIATDLNGELLMLIRVAAAGPPAIQANRRIELLRRRRQMHCDRPAPTHEQSVVEVDTPDVQLLTQMFVALHALAIR
jgi:hypothetical protein